MISLLSTAYPTSGLVMPNRFAINAMLSLNSLNTRFPFQWTSTFPPPKGILPVAHEIALILAQSREPGTYTGAIAPPTVIRTHPREPFPSLHPNPITLTLFI